MTHGFLPLGTFCPPLIDRPQAVFTGRQQPKPDRFAAQTPSVSIPSCWNPQVADSKDRQTLQRRQTAQAHDWQSANAGMGVQRAHSSTTIAEHLSQARLGLAGLARLGQRARRQRQLEMERIWLAANRHRYSGRWIALDGDRLLAVGSSSREVFSEVANHAPAPLVIHIVEQELPFAGW
jgi:hypothetical protein